MKKITNIKLFSYLNCNNLNEEVNKMKKENEKMGFEVTTHFDMSQAMRYCLVVVTKEVKGERSKKEVENTVLMNRDEESFLKLLGMLVEEKQKFGECTIEYKNREGIHCAGIATR